MIDKIIGRSLAPSLEAALRQPQPMMIALVGARQVGKSTLLGQLLPPERTLVVNFDSGEVRDRVLSRESHLLEQLEEKNGGPLGKGSLGLTLCVDEAQKLPESFEILKQLHDRFAPSLRIILSGSSSLLIRKHTAETLAGRIRYFQLHPFSLEEAGRFTGLKKEDDVMTWLGLLLEGRMTDSIGRTVEKRKRHLKGRFLKLVDEWCLWGLMPPRLHFEKEEDWILFLRDYVDTYIEKDMRATERIGSLGDYKKLVRLAGNQIGNLINHSKMASELQIHRQTVKEYLQILDESLLGFRLPAYSESIARRVTKAEKSFLIDNGMAHYFMELKDAEVLEASGQIGALYENLFVAEFRKYGGLLKAPLDLFYWRLSGVQPPEVDLILRYRGLIIPVEIKRRGTIQSNDLRGIRHFFSLLKKKKGALPYGVIIYRGDYRYLKEERIFLVPDWFFA